MMREVGRPAYALISRGYGATGPPTLTLRRGGQNAGKRNKIGTVEIMSGWHAVALAAALVIAADVRGVANLRQSAQQTAPPDSLPVAAPQTDGPASSQAGQSGTAGKAGGQAQAQPKRASRPLTPESQLLLVRYVSSEFAKAVQAIPAGKKGFKIRPGKPVGQQDLSDALRLYGTGAFAGDTVQITGLEFRSHEILVQINGGGKKHFHWRQHLQIGIGAVGTAPPPESPSDRPTGGVLVVDYGRAVPDMSPDDLKRDLAPFLDFSKQHSAAVNWVETLPPQYQQAIKDHTAVVGMDQEMVIAAMGRPDKKVRQRDSEGKETEDWIYGEPPARTVFVTFNGDSVIRVTQYN